MFHLEFVSILSFFVWRNRFHLHQHWGDWHDFMCDRFIFHSSLMFKWMLMRLRRTIVVRTLTWAHICCSHSLCEIVRLNFYFFFFRNGFTQLLILSIHPLPEAYLGLCCFFPQAATQSPSVGSWSIPQLDGMKNIIHPICPGLGWCNLHAWKLGTRVGPPTSTDSFPCTGCMNGYLNSKGVDTWSHSTTRIVISFVPLR